MVSHEIIGDDMQAVILSLTQGDAVRAEAGAMMFMTEGVEMDARMDGGLLGGLKRALLVEEASSSPGFAARPRRRASRSPRRTSGKIIPIDLKERADPLPEGRVPLRRRDIGISVAFTKQLGASYFGGGVHPAKSQGKWARVRACGAKSTMDHAQGTGDRSTRAGSSRSTDRRLRHHPGRRPQDQDFRRRRPFLRVPDGTQARLARTLPFSRDADRVNAAQRGDREDVKRDLGGMLGGLGDLIGGDPSTRPRVSILDSGVLLRYEGVVRPPVSRCSGRRGGDLGMDVTVYKEALLRKRGEIRPRAAGRPSRYRRRWSQHAAG